MDFSILLFIVLIFIGMTLNRRSSKFGVIALAGYGMVVVLSIPAALMLTDPVDVHVSEMERESQFEEGDTSDLALLYEGERTAGTIQLREDDENQSLFTEVHVIEENIEEIRLYHVPTIVTRPEVKLESDSQVVDVQKAAEADQMTFGPLVYPSIIDHSSPGLPSPRGGGSREPVRAILIVPPGTEVEADDNVMLYNGDAIEESG
ncbi:hypothetical protein [Alkalicoccus chagannorensis]|uniref:hypothetical protein n=1 Tax=Alkalicoccus chagannorensis TaxID=427072 RepID=UPI00040E9921|nr:hypothetical protein [Alkalicoccus chagannorensis]